MPRRARRTRLRGGLTPSQHWALTYGVELLPSNDPDPWATEEDARILWRRHRDQIMSEALPGCAPMGLFRHELESFASPAAILALRLDPQSLQKAVYEFEECTNWHRRNGREQLAREFEERAARVHLVLSQMGTSNNA